MVRWMVGNKSKITFIQLVWWSDVQRGRVRPNCHLHVVPGWELGGCGVCSHSRSPVKTVHNVHKPGRRLNICWWVNNWTPTSSTIPGLNFYRSHLSRVTFNYYLNPQRFSFWFNTSLLLRLIRPPKLGSQDVMLMLILMLVLMLMLASQFKFLSRHLRESKDAYWCLREPPDIGGFAICKESKFFICI